MIDVSKLLADGGTYGEPEPDDLHDRSIDPAVRDYFATLRFHLFRFHPDGTFLYCWIDADLYGSTEHVEEGTYALDDDTLVLAYTQRHTCSNRRFEGRSVTHEQDPYTERIPLREGPDGVELDAEAEGAHGATTRFVPIRRCPAQQVWLDELDDAVAECRSLATLPEAPGEPG